jgi:hypothetical protein
VVVQTITRVTGQEWPEDETGREGVSGDAGGRGATVSVRKAKGEMMVDAGEVDEHEA